MKNFILLFLIVAMIACVKKENTNQSISKNYKLEIDDSIRVSQLEELTLIDSEDGLFLAKKKGLSSYIIFDETGKITSPIELKSDGPNAINMSYSEGFFDGK